MSAHGCKVFAETLLANPDAAKTFDESVDGGLTVFCPGDDAFKAFLPKYKNLSAPGKSALLEYHGVPVYQSMSMLKSNNGLMNTLATNGAEKYDVTVQNDGQAVTLKNKLVTAKIDQRYELWWKCGRIYISGVYLEMVEEKKLEQRRVWFWTEQVLRLKSGGLNKVEAAENRNKKKYLT